LEGATGLQVRVPMVVAPTWLAARRGGARRGGRSHRRDRSRQPRAL